MHSDGRCTVLQLNYFHSTVGQMAVMCRPLHQLARLSVSATGLLHHGNQPCLRRSSFCTYYGNLGQQDDSSVPKRYLGQPTPFTHKHLLKRDEITPEITRQEYMDRRNALMAAIGRSLGSTNDTNHVVVVLSADKKYMTEDIPYPFRQNTSFLYLTGFQEPDSALVLESLPNRTLPEHKATLYVQQRDPERELWDGPRAGTEGALQFLGVDKSKPIGELSEMMYSLSQNKTNLVGWYDVFKPPNVVLDKEVKNNFVQPCRNKGHSINILENILQSQRVIKSRAEQSLMRTSASIAANAIRDVMLASHPGVKESMLYAKLDFGCRIRGAEYLAYPPVIAGGNRANTLHYISNNQVILDNEMVLLDAGCEYHGYASDITRTWPVNGRFTDSQADVYQAVLNVQKDCIEMCVVGGTLDQVYHFMLVELGKHLQSLSVIPYELAEWELCKLAKRYCPHHVSHYLGMDTHDTGRVSRSSQLQPGMVVTIEPGLYIAESDTSAPAKYRGIGIRIEDDILITANGPEVLSAECPKEICDIQDLFQR